MILKDGIDVNVVDILNEVLAFDPGEWEAIAITIQHLQHNLKPFRKMKTDEERNEWFKENANFLAIVRDLVCLWEHRLPARNKA